MNDEGEEDLELVSKMAELYDKLGVSVYNSEGELKNTFELLESLAEVYPTLTAAEKAYVTETIAGKYQAQNAAAILNNFQTALDATATAYDSTGSAAKENEKVLDGINGKLNNLKSQFEELSKNMINSDLIKFFLDFGTVVLKVINSDIAQSIIKFSSFIVVINGLGLAFDLVSKKFNNFYTKIINGIDLLRKYYQYSKIANQSNKVLGDGFVIASESVGTLTTAEQAQILVEGKALASKLALDGAITGIITLLNLGISLWRKYKEEQQKAFEQSIEDATSLDNKVSEISDLSTKIKNLREITDNSNSTYQESIDARKELIEIQNDLIKNYGAEAEKIDLVSGSIDTQIDYLKKLRQEAAQDYLDNNEKSYKDAKKSIEKEHMMTGDDVVGKYNTIGNSLLYYGIKKDYTTTNKNRQDSLYSSHANITQGTYDDLAKQLNEAAQYLEENREKIAEYYSIKIEAIDEQIEKIKEKAQYYSSQNSTEKEVVSAYDEKSLTAAGYDIFREKLLELSETGVITKENIENLISQFPGLDDALNKNSITTDSLLKEFQNLNTVYETLLNNNEGLSEFLGNITLDGKVTEDEINKLKEKFPELEKQIQETGYSFEDFIEKFPKYIFEIVDDMTLLSDELDNIQSAYETATSALEEYNENGYFSIDTLQQLIEMEPKYLNAIIDENGVIRDNIDIFKALTEAELDKMQASENSRYLSELNRLATMSEAKAAQLAAASIDAHNQAMAGQEVNANALREQIKKNIDAFNEEAAAALKAAEAENEAKHNRINAIIENTRGGLDNYYSSSSSSGSSSGSSSSKEWWEIELEKLQDQFKYNEITIEEYIKGLDNLLSRVQDGTEAWRQINEELQKQRLTKVEDDYKRGTISLDEYINKLKELIKAYRAGTDAWNDLADKIKDALQDKLDQQKDDLETAEKAAIGLIDKEIEKQEQLRDEKEEYYDKLIADKKAANEETERELELARLEEALENAKNEKTKRVEYMLSIKMAQNGETPEEDNTVGKICFEI